MGQTTSKGRPSSISLLLVCCRGNRVRRTPVTTTLRTTANVDGLVVSIDIVSYTSLCMSAFRST
jgi:hypothetical protein